ncbi:hypothetical protein K2173_006695 [Erythroxylum novogranatense]|uniref:Homeodomain protein n=1 Tax=Erythroxylum novogranatense TaxID=1862640 RepID=A0AAV8TEW4_9ROSI|nr:hypothetical protein K2173_006695 [Erythroxylum novogranatense]
MEAAGDAGDGEEVEKRKAPSGGEFKTKRKMKTASQLEILEKTYAANMYPPEALRAELSVQLGLSDRQLQMWFCHRRLKDRKPPPVKRQHKSSPALSFKPSAGEELVTTSEMQNDPALGPAPESSSFGSITDPLRVARPSGVAVSRICIADDVPATMRYYDPQQSIAELRAITFDGPILGMEFDPYLRMPLQPGWPFEAKLYERCDVQVVKGTTRVLHEYQFLPQQPTVRGDAYERVVPSYQCGSCAETQNVKTVPLGTASPFVRLNEHVPPGLCLQSQIPTLNLMAQDGRPGHLLHKTVGDYENVLPKNPFTNVAADAKFGTQPIIDNPFTPADRKVTHDEDVLHIERKRKGEEARIAREVEAHEKRIRKELEKQDNLRRKREEQIRKEMERHDRERRKEEERFLREKQREVERYQREKRRELERREKFLQKESIRAEKLKQKEEQRREKEAARQKAANERAIARKIAKESTELVEDERLELMELATLSKGLPSVLSLDFETLQNLDLYRDKLSMFPPKSVLLSRPLLIQPWSDSEENVANLLMVWRFLMTFADVLGIWPFTLDEFVQAFHDYDTRLLGELHIALLRSIIKDIEDVARTPASGLGTNQNTAVNPGGGHPHIVAGAYAWGFDIRNWQQHLNPLTWPEILRQFALSAGLGPQLKKRNIEQAHHDNEGNDGEDVINNLRNGAAVENAVAKMQERGFSNTRRSRHRLTPGTVKFAAFHVLSLEGSNGLTILEVTPEASVAAALSRDTKLFERTAPSTYCVRPAYRKDPTDADAILAAARERIRVFTGFADGEDAEDAERDDDSESDGPDDPEVDDLVTELKPKEEAYPEGNEFNSEAAFGIRKQINEVLRTPNGVDDNEKVHAEGLNGAKDVDTSSDQSVGVADVCTNLDQGDDVDESNLGEPWVQVLIEANYSDLSVEERLNALVALIGVAIEGNSIRIVLEERLEAANALKKQMWAEAQLDKRRMKEEYIVKMHYPPFVGNKIEPNLTMSTSECKESSFMNDDEKSSELPLNIVQQEQLSVLQGINNHLNNIPSERNVEIQDSSACLDNLSNQQLGQVAERSRSQLKSFIAQKAEEMYAYRSLPLGLDRGRNRYWQFTTSSSHNDPGSGRIFVELHDGRWRLVETEEGFDSLLASLDIRGIRESYLHMMLQKIEVTFKKVVRRNTQQTYMEKQSGDPVQAEAVGITSDADISANIDIPSNSTWVADLDMNAPSTSFRIEIGRTEAEKIISSRECANHLVLRSMKCGNKRCEQILNVCDYCHDIVFYEDNQCPSCHKTYEASGSNLNFCNHEDKHIMDRDSSLYASASPLGIRLLKLLLALIEVSIPSEALLPLWTNDYRKSWGLKLWYSASAKDLLQILTLLEIAIKRDYLSPNFETTSELLGSEGNDSSSIERIPVLPWLPQTTAAVALRILQLDSSISCMVQEKVAIQKDRSNGIVIKLSTKQSVANSIQDDKTAETSRQGGFSEEQSWIGFGGLCHGRGKQGRRHAFTNAGRLQKGGIGSRYESSKRTSNTKSGMLRQELVWKLQPRARGRKRGRRSTRSRKKSVKKAIDIVSKGDISKQVTNENSPKGLVGDEWNAKERRHQVEDTENAGSSEGSDYNNNHTPRNEYDLAVHEYGGFGGGLMDGSSTNIDVNEENENGNYLDEDDGDQGDIDVGEYINGDMDEGRVGEASGERNEDPDEGTGSTSSDFSDWGN